jgi:NAD(P)-dependent dehydrogenase (short-subunit alcohol dehydrogenase family)
MSPLFEAAFRLDGKTALVTGGGTGIGLAIARCLAAAGARVLIAGRRLDVLEQAAAESPELVPLLLDLTRPEEIARFVAAAGPVDILVNNAGNTVKKPFVESSLADFDSVFDVHVRGALELTRHIVPSQVARGGGVVLFVASMTSFIGQPLVLGYTAAKSAIVGIVRGLSAEFAAQGVRVNAVAPGWIDTALFRAATAGDEPRRQKILGRIQAKRLGTPEDIGWACVYLAAPAGGYVTGQTLVVDGGALVGF